MTYGESTAPTGSFATISAVERSKYYTATLFKWPLAEMASGCSTQPTIPTPLTPPPDRISLFQAVSKAFPLDREPAFLESIIQMRSSRSFGRSCRRFGSVLWIPSQRYCARKTFQRDSLFRCSGSYLQRIRWWPQHRHRILSRSMASLVSVFGSPKRSLAWIVTPWSGVSGGTHSAGHTLPCSVLLGRSSRLCGADAAFNDPRHSRYLHPR